MGAAPVRVLTAGVTQVVVVGTDVRRDQRPESRPLQHHLSPINQSSSRSVLHVRTYDAVFWPPLAATNWSSSELGATSGRQRRRRRRRETTTSIGSRAWFGGGGARGSGRLTDGGGAGLTAAQLSPPPPPLSPSSRSPTLVLPCAP